MDTLTQNLHTRAEQLEALAQHMLEPSTLLHVLPTLAQRTELSVEMLRWGLRETLSRWTRDALLDLIVRELGPPDTWVPARTLGVVLASTVPSAGLLATVLPWLIGAETHVRPAHAIAPLLQAFVQLPNAPDVHLHIFPSRNTERARALAQRCNVLVIHGGDTVIEAWRHLAPDSTRVVGRGHRVSAAFLSAQATSLEDACAGFALDLCAWDQTGCLSPLVLYIEHGDHTLHDVGRALARAVERLESTLPPGAWSEATRAYRTGFVRSRLLEAERLQAGRAELLLYDTPSPPEEHCLHRVLELRPVQNEAELITTLERCPYPLQGLAVAGPHTLRQQLARALAHRGINWVCPPGALQRPPLHWSHDGAGELRPLVHWLSVA